MANWGKGDPFFHLLCHYNSTDIGTNKPNSIIVAEHRGT